MDIRELKNKITNDELSDDPMIWVLTDDSSNILTNQYIRAICMNKGLLSKAIDSEDEIPEEGFITDNHLYIIRRESVDDLPKSNNCIILCNKSRSKEAIVIPRLEDWQVVDYLTAQAPGIKKSDLEWLVMQYNDWDGGYFRMMSDIEKISIFSESSQAQIFNKFLEDGEFKDITSINIWDLTNGIIRRDKNLVKEVLKVIDYIDVEPTGLITALYKGFKNVIDIQLNPKASAEELGIKSNQYYVIKKYNCNHYTRDELVEIFKLISNAEYLYKYGGIGIENIVNYLVLNIMGDK